MYAQQQPVFARSSSHQSHHNNDPHAYADGEDKYDGGTFGPLDEETEREYERRYAREKAMARERRPTLGDSVMGLVSKVGRVLGSERR